MEKKRKPIRRKVRQTMLFVSVFALLVAGGLGISSMYHIQKQVIQDSSQLGDHATASSAEAMLDQMQENLLYLAQSKSQLADAKFMRISGYVNEFSGFLSDLYTSQESYSGVEVLPPDKENAGQLVPQRILANASVSIADVQEEMELLANTGTVFQAVMEANGNTVENIYFGTESGVLVCYDTYSDRKDTGDGEEYYDYFESVWYQQAKEAGEVIFTETYEDRFGQGLMMSCAAPFYDAKGSLAGVVAMDIRIRQMTGSIISMDSDEDIYAFLLDQQGNVLASPKMDMEQAEFLNIYEDTSCPAYEVAELLTSGQSGVAETSQDVYYAYAPITAADWTLGIHIPASVVTDQAKQIRSTIESDTASTIQSIQSRILWSVEVFVIVFAVIVVLVYVFSNKFANRIVRPLVTLRDDVMTIRGGRLDYRVRVESNDEIGDLAEAFNNMTISLQEYIHNLTVVTAEKERIGAELQVATQIQAAMLPSVFPAFPEHREFELFAAMNPAKEVGGDFYDFFLIDDDHLALVIADVSGKGVPAALFMVIARTLIKNQTLQGTSPKQTLEIVNNQLCENNEAQMFVTVWLGILEISTGKIIAGNAGHEYPAVKGADGEFALLMDAHDFVLAGIEDMPYEEYELQLEPGSTLYLYTDGVAEAMDSGEKLFGTDRLLTALNKNPDGSPKELIRQVKEDIEDFVGEAEQFDDITMLAVHYYGTGVSGT